jgi:hypothetical protein
MAKTKEAKDAPAAPLWQRIRDLEGRRDGLIRQLDGVEAELLALAGELAATVRNPGPPVAPPAPGRKANTFTARVLAAVTEELGAPDVIRKLGLKTRDRRRVYDVLKKEAGREGGTIRRTTMGAFEPRTP